MMQKSRREPDYGFGRLSRFEVRTAELLELGLQIGEHAAQVGNLCAQG